MQFYSSLEIDQLTIGPLDHWTIGPPNYTEGSSVLESALMLFIAVVGTMKIVIISCVLIRSWIQVGPRNPRVQRDRASLHKHALFETACTAALMDTLG